MVSQWSIGIKHVEGLQGVERGRPLLKAGAGPGSGMAGIKMFHVDVVKVVADCRQDRSGESDGNEVILVAVGLTKLHV